ncbi:hypothetical protein [Rhodoferax ferrireducens]|uniref:hypothetical protein n=1 Tax=Rhodoferax ferrireducens TaxID=192843 RepID=UPI000E0D671F|nr:hypothetical protein [Rhodoferax ferrireducens]
MAFSARKFDAWLLLAFAAIVTPVLAGILDATGQSFPRLRTDGTRGVSIFGVSGHLNVVDTTEAAAPAAAADIGYGKKAYVNGALVVGTATSGTCVATPTGACRSKTNYKGSPVDIGVCGV